MKTGCIARLQSRVRLSPNTSSSKLTQIQTGCSNSWSVELVKYDDLKERMERHWEYVYSQYTPECVFLDKSSHFLATRNNEYLYNTDFHFNFNCVEINFNLLIN